jgi:hypothetical protein
MSAKAKSAAARPPTEPTPLPVGSAPLSTTEERLQRIEALGERVAEHVRFMCGVGGLTGVSAEAKAKAVEAFCERLSVLELQLGRIEEDLRLG